MKRVTGIGGIFFKCKDTKRVNEWYRKHLGFNTEDYGTTFEWRQANDPSKKGFTVWGTFKEDTTYFAPSQKEFMINLRVDDLEGLLKILKQEGIEQIGETLVYSYGKFAHIMDPEGNKIELWEPHDKEYEDIVGVTTK